MDENMKEFIAFSKKLLRSLVQIRDALDAGSLDIARKLLDDLIEDTESDIQA